MRIPLAFVVLVAGSLFVAASPLPAVQTPNEVDAEQTRILALENAWNQAEEHKDVRALDSLLDPSLVYIDYDGSMLTKAQFMASVQAPELHPEQIINESMMARVYGGSAVVTGIYREKGVQNGKPYLRRGRFTDTWVYQNGMWTCVASQSTLILH